MLRHRAAFFVRRWMCTGALLAAAWLGACAPAASLATTARSEAAPSPKVLRVSSPSETGFDPARVGDVPSLAIVAHIFEPLLEYDPLARPVKLRPRTAAAMPTASADFRSWTFRIRPGIRFDDHPAFGGRPRELTAADYAYSLKRIADPANKSPAWSSIEQLGIAGLAERRREAVDGRRPFDYAAPVAGLQTPDRYTLVIRTEAGRPRLDQQMAVAATGAVAREVIDAVGDASMEVPVGTGPFRLAEWRRASRIVLERNPGFRERRYHAEPAADDAEGQAIARRLAGRRLPMVDRVEIAIIDEAQPEWLAFINGELDAVFVPPEFTVIAAPGGRLAPHLARRGVHLDRTTIPATYYTMFNMEHPLVGGYAPPQVALRRAIGMAIDVGREIALLRQGLGVPAQSPVAVHLSGYDPAYKSEMSTYDPARARALLDLYGYVDRDGDGWREQPDGRPLVLEMATQPTHQTRRYDELMKRDMDAIGLRIVFKPAKWPEQYKAARAGRLMLWSVQGRAGAPDGLEGLQRYAGADKGGINLSRFDLPAMNALIERLLALPDGPEREAAFFEAKRLTAAWMPYKLRTHAMLLTLTQPWVVGYRRPLFWHHWYESVDVERDHAAP